MKKSLLILIALTITGASAQPFSYRVTDGSDSYTEINEATGVQIYQGLGSQPTGSVDFYNAADGAGIRVNMDANDILRFYRLANGFVQSTELASLTPAGLFTATNISATVAMTVSGESLSGETPTLLDVVGSAGSSGEVLTSQGASDDAIWASIPTELPTGSEGDMLIYASGEWVALPHPGANYILTTTATSFEWVAQAAISPEISW